MSQVMHADWLQFMPRQELFPPLRRIRKIHWLSVSCMEYITATVSAFPFVAHLNVVLLP